MSDKKHAASIAGLALAGVVALGGGTAVMSAWADTPSASPSASSSSSSSSSSSAPNEQDGRGPGHAPHEHTAVTGDELAKVTAAVKAKDSAITVTKVEKDPDGSYDVSGTKSGQQVRLEASKDLKTITEGKGGPGGKGHHGPRGTEVTGAELTKVTAAVKAKDSSFTVEHVVKDDQGAYHVMGTKSGDRAGYEVSKDLKTITAHTPGDGHRGGR